MYSCIRVYAHVCVCMRLVETTFVGLNALSTSCTILVRDTVSLSCFHLRWRQRLIAFSRNFSLCACVSVRGDIVTIIVIFIVIAPTSITTSTKCDVHARRRTPHEGWCVRVVNANDHCVSVSVSLVVLVVVVVDIVVVVKSVVAMGSSDHRGPFPRYPPVFQMCTSGRPD